MNFVCVLWNFALWIKITMKYIFLIILICQISWSEIGHTVLSVNSGNRNETIITIDAQTHIDYGLAYPVTYEFIIPAGSDNLQSYCRFQSTQDWSQIVEKTPEDFFNGIKAVRFDYDENTAYVSIGFSDFSDSIFIKITDSDGNNIDATYSGMSQYYDNRDAAVTSTADDWAYWNNDEFVQTCENFRSFNLWLSCAIVRMERIRIHGSIFRPNLIPAMWKQSLILAHTPMHLTMILKVKYWAVSRI